MNTIGHIFQLTSFGESHGTAIGGVIDGFPAGVKINLPLIQQELRRRRPGQSNITTNRKESDEVELLSGIYDGISTGCPIGFIIRNANQHSSDYEELRTTFRPSHADYTYEMKYGIRDHRGGGRSSARETATRIVAGTLAQMVLQHYDIKVTAFTSAIGDIVLDDKCVKEHFAQIEKNKVRTTDMATAERMERLIMETKEKGDTVGGVICCIVENCPPGIGEPVFNKLHADLGAAMLSINAAKGFEIGDGFRLAQQFGSQSNDIFTSTDNAIHTLTNHSGGIQGGITNGEDIVMRIAFKPVATILKDIETVNRDGTPTTLHMRGRHDPCVVPRAVPIVEAMARMVILDHLLLQRTTHL